MARHWTWWIATAVLAVVCYVVLWLGCALHWAWLQTMDYAVLDPLHAFGVKHPAWVRFWEVFCTVFSPEGFRLLGAVAVVVAVLRRNLRVIVFLLTTIGLSGVLALVAKDMVGRPRPVGALTASVSSVFPSGHAIAAMVGVLALLTISAGRFSPRIRSVMIVLGVTVVLAVSFGRLALNVHYPSDVVAGWALGYLWYLGWLLVIRPVSLARAAAPDKTPRALTPG
jgi:membrane-associated phospholipid phosphatase